MNLYPTDRWLWLAVTTAIILVPAVSPAEEPLSRAAIESRLTESVKYLASDELEGRGIATAGIDKAADYLAGQFRDMGLDTRQYQGTPFHTFYLGTRFGLGPDNSLTLSIPDAKPVDWVVKSDFTPLSLSGSGKIDLPLAFVGYGITAPKLNYDDYAGLDVTGRAVIVLRNEPRKSDPASPFDGAQTSEFGVASHKITNAIAHGAAAIVFITDAASLEPANPADAPQSDPLVPFLIKSTAGDRKIPVLHCRRAAVEPLLKSVLKTDLASLETQIDTDLKPHSAVLPGGQLRGEISVIRQGKPLKNVVAVLPGQGPHAAETIVIGAHYDHLGYGGSGSLAFTVKKEIHNGADDNGSGTAVLVEVARQLSLRHARQPLGRRVVCIAFTAEESGLIGSERYVRDPLIPLNQTVAMLNMDMVGRLRDEKLTIYGTGTASEFDALVDQLGMKHAFVVNKKPGGFGPSDHASFYERGIPVLHFFTGLHKQYHRPEDDSPLLNVAGMARISELVTESVEALAAADQRPTPRKVFGGDEIDGLFESLLGIDDKGTSGTPPKAKGSGQPYLGIALKKAGDNPQETGAIIDTVAAKGPADVSGLRAGDVIVKFGEDPIREPADLILVMKKLKAGEKHKVQVRRDGVELELEATVGVR